MGSSLESALSAMRGNHDRFEPSVSPSSVTMAPLTELQPGYSSITRCPLPPINAAPDSLRTFYLGGKVPQMRLFPPNASQSNGSTVAGGTTNVTSTISSTSVTNVNNIVATQASLSTPVLVPNVVFTSSIAMAKAFILLSVSSSSPARVTIYGSATAQTSDVSRPITQSPAAGSMQNVISDIYLDDVPLQWSYQNRVGMNADSPQQSVIYINVTNVDVSAESVTVSFTYLPIET